MILQGGASRKIEVFAGPSLQEYPDTPGVTLRPPAGRGDLTSAADRGADTIVFIDGVFKSRPTVGHREILDLVKREVTVIGAASMGALRAVELRNHGVAGCGTAYNAVLRGFVTDDGELAVAMCPYTYRALTVSLIEVRRLIALALDGGCNASDAERAFAAAQSVFFMERTQPRLANLWASSCHSPSQIVNLLNDDRVALKRRDAVTAIDKALGRSQADQPRMERIFWEGRVADLAMFGTTAGCTPMYEEPS